MSSAKLAGSKVWEDFKLATPLINSGWAGNQLNACGLGSDYLGLISPKSKNVISDPEETANRRFA